MRRPSIVKPTIWLLVGVLVTPALAMADASNISGTGFKSCSELAELKKDPDAYGRLATWMQGYFSGMNSANDLEGKPQRDVSTLSSEDGLMSLLAKVEESCADKPDDPLVMHIYPLYETLPEYHK